MNKQIKDKKLYNEEDLRKMMNNSPYLMWIKDRSGIYRFVNKEFLNYFCLDKKDVMGKRGKDIFDIRNKKMCENCEEKIIINNKVKWLQYYAWPLYTSGEKEGWIAGIGKNITSIRLIEELVYDPSEIIDREKFSNFLNSFMEQTKSCGAGIFLYDKDKKSVMLEESCGCCNNIERHYSFYMSDIEYGKSDVGEHLKKFSDENEEIWIKHLNRFFDNTYIMFTHALSTDDDIIGFFILMYKDNIEYSLRENKFIEHICDETAYLYMKKNIMEDLNIELKKREKNELYMKLLLDITTDFYGILNVDEDNRKFSVDKIYNSSVDKKELIKLIEGLEYNDNAGNLISNIGNYDVRSDLCRIKGKDNDQFIEFRWHSEGDGKVIITGKDRTTEKKLEDYNKELAKYIEIEKMKSDFFANISHEFKTPLNIMITASQLIKYKNIRKNSDNNRDMLENYLTATKQSGYRLLRLINNLLDVRTIDKGFFQLELDNYNIVDVIKKSVQSMKEYLEEKNRKFYIESDCNEIILACDPEKIRRILMNLISNAVKYTDDYDYIKVNIKRDFIKNRAVITVENNGVQLDEKNIKIIFNTFTKAGNVLSRRCEGSGIGLYIVKSLVELHNGEIWADISEENKTKFIFELPIDCVKNGIGNKNIKFNSDKIESCLMEFSDIY